MEQECPPPSTRLVRVWNKGICVAVGERIRQFRNQRGMTEEQLGELLNVRHSQISKMETGKSKIDADRLPVLAELLGVHPCDFFIDDGQTVHVMQVKSGTDGKNVPRGLTVLDGPGSEPAYDEAAPAEPTRAVMPARNPARSPNDVFVAGFMAELFDLARLSPTRMAIVQSVLRGLDEAGVE